MSADPQNVFAVNGINYDRSLLHPGGEEILSLITEAQNEVSKHNKQILLLDAAQQHLISKLKPLLPKAIQDQESNKNIILGSASDTLPTTEAMKPQEQLPPFPDNIPDDFKP